MPENRSSTKGAEDDSSRSKVKGPAFGGRSGSEAESWATKLPEGLFSLMLAVVTSRTGGESLTSVRATVSKVVPVAGGDPLSTAATVRLYVGTVSRSSLAATETTPVEGSTEK